MTRCEDVRTDATGGRRACSGFRNNGGLRSMIQAIAREDDDSAVMDAIRLVISESQDWTHIEQVVPIVDQSASPNRIAERGIGMEFGAKGHAKMHETKPSQELEISKSKWKDERGSRFVWWRLARQRSWSRPVRFLQTFDLRNLTSADRAHLTYLRLAFLAFILLVL